MRNLGSSNRISPHLQWIKNFADLSVRGHMTVGDGKMERPLLRLGVWGTGPVFSPKKETTASENEKKTCFVFATHHLILFPAIINILLLYCFYVMLCTCVCLCDNDYTVSVCALNIAFFCFHENHFCAWWLMVKNNNVILQDFLRSFCPAKETSQSLAFIF